MMNETNLKQRYVFIPKKKKYFGPVSKMFSCIFIFLFFPVVPFICYYPCDVKEEIVLEKQSNLLDLNDDYEDENKTDDDDDDEHDDDEKYNNIALAI